MCHPHPQRAKSALIKQSDVNLNLTEHRLHALPPSSAPAAEPSSHRSGLLRTQPAIGRRIGGAIVVCFYLGILLCLCAHLSFTSAQLAPPGGGTSSTLLDSTGVGGDYNPLISSGSSGAAASLGGSAVFGNTLPDYPPINVTFLPGQCQFVPKWPGPRCPSGWECISTQLARSDDTSGQQLSYRQEQCVFCAVTEFCTDQQKAECQTLDIFNDTQVYKIVNDTAGVGECYVCREGQYCPADGVNNTNPFGLAIVNLCPEGAYCPTADRKLQCPEGFFCPTGTKFPLACTTLGTYCEPGSTDPKSPCPGGSYCPNPQTKIECPAGNFCKSGSIEPKKCQGLASCPSGSAAALIFWQGILEVILIYAAMACLYFAVIYVQKRRRRTEKAEAEHEAEGHEVVQLLKRLRSFRSLEGGEDGEEELPAKAPLVGDYEKQVNREVKIEKGEKVSKTPSKEYTLAKTAHDNDFAIIKKRNREDSDSSNSESHSAVGKEEVVGIAENPHKGKESQSNVAEKDEDMERAMKHESVNVILPANGASAENDPNPKDAGVRSVPVSKDVKTNPPGDDKSREAMSSVDAAATSSSASPSSGSDSDSDDDPEFTGFDPIAVPISIQFEQLGLKLKNGHEVLQEVSGTFPAGKLVAVMGPSGCGKSTFLNVLCGKATYGIQTGKIKLNGVQCNMPAVRSIMGFVPQADTLHTDLTCFENLYYSAMLRLPRNMPNGQKLRIVDDTVQMLGLEAVKHSVVGNVEKRGISGGQMKRVNIGMEIVSSPSLLFMDEPTSGLDATASLEVVSALRDLTQLGMTIVTVIHQPRFSIVELFHEIMLLGKGGQLVFLGNSQQALAYFQDLGFPLPPNENPADFFSDVLSGEVRRLDDPDFEPSDLQQLWIDKGEWVRRGELQPPTATPADTVATAGSIEPIPVDSNLNRSSSLMKHGNSTPYGMESPMQPRLSSASKRLPSLNTRTPLVLSNDVFNYPNEVAVYPQLPPAANNQRSQTSGPTGNTLPLYFDRQSNSPLSITRSGKSGRSGRSGHHHTHHRRTQSQYHVMTAYRDGVSSLAQVPLPKHRELLNKIGRDKAAKLVEEYRAKMTPKPPRSTTAAGSHPLWPKHFGEPKSHARHASVDSTASTKSVDTNTIAHHRRRALSRALSSARLNMLFEHSKRNNQLRKQQAGAQQNLTPYQQQQFRSASHPEALSDEEAEYEEEIADERTPFTPHERESAPHATYLDAVPSSLSVAPPAWSKRRDRSSGQYKLDHIIENDVIGEEDSSTNHSSHGDSEWPMHSSEGVTDADQTLPAGAAAVSMTTADDATMPQEPLKQLPTAEKVGFPRSHSAVAYMHHGRREPDHAPKLESIPSESEGEMSAHSKSRSKSALYMPHFHDESATPVVGSPAVQQVKEGTPRTSATPKVVNHSPDAKSVSTVAPIHVETGAENGRVDVPDGTFAKSTTTDGAVVANASLDGALPVVRRLPHIHAQFLHLLQRQSLKLMRSINEVIFDMTLTTAVGLAIGLIYGGVWSLNGYATISTMAVLSIGVLACVSALKMFGNDRVVFWRESSAGISETAYWLAVTLFHLPFSVVFSFLFVAPYYYLILPDTPFLNTWWIFIAVHFACSGGGMLLSICLKPIPALLSAVMIPLIVGGFLNGVSPPLSEMGEVMTGLCDISYSRYGVEALILEELQVQPEHAESVVDDLYQSIGFQPNQVTLAIGNLFVIGLAFRLFSFLALHALNRSKRM